MKRWFAMFYNSNTDKFITYLHTYCESTSAQEGFNLRTSKHNSSYSQRKTGRQKTRSQKRQKNAKRQRYTE